MAGLASINIKFSADLAQFSTQMQNANRKISKMGKSMRSLGGQLSAGLTLPFLAFSGIALKNFDKQEKAIAQVNSGLQSTGRYTDELSKKLQDQASVLQENSLFGDEEILQGATAQILTFTNISTDKIARVNQVVADLSTRLKVDLKSSSIQVGKALNDPVANLSALSRSGIQFSESQKQMINSLVETNQLAKAQDLILSELEKQYGGSAKAAAEAGTGWMKQLANSIGDVTEEFGKIINSAIKPFVKRLKTIITSFKNLSPATKKFIVLLGGIAAAVGPLLALAGTILPAIATGFALLTGPVGLIVAGLTTVGLIIYKKWQPIKRVLVDIANYFIDLYNESTVFRVAVEGVILTFKNIWSVGKFVFEGIKSVLKGLVNSFVNNFKLIGRIVKAVLTGSFKDIPDIIKNFREQSKSNFKTFGKDLKADWGKLMVDVSTNSKTALENIGKRTKIKFLEKNVDTEGVKKAVKSITPVEIESKVVERKRKASTASVLKPVGIKPLIISDGLSEENKKLESGLTKTNDHLVDFSETLSNSITDLANNVVSGFSEMIGGLLNGALTMGDVAGSLLAIVGDIAVGLGKAAIKIGIGMLAIKAAFKNPLTAIAAGVALVALGSFIKGIAGKFSGNDKKNYAGAFTNGGVIGGTSYYGDKLFARVNSGEMILNKSQQANLSGLISNKPNVDLSTIKLHISGLLKASGRDLKAVIAEQNVRDLRLG